MKKLALTLLCMAASSALLATPKEKNTNYTGTPGNSSAQVATTQNTSLGSPAFTNAAADECAVSSITTSASDSESCNSKSEDTLNKNPIKKKSTNRAYSLTNEVTYTTGIGIRAGGRESGLSLKHFFGGNAALEAILSTGWEYRGARITGLYQIQKPIGSEGWYWFWGVGGHAGLYNDRYWRKGECRNGQYEFRGELYNCEDNRPTLGVDAIVGFEYHFLEVPITVTLDAKPSVDVLGWGGRHYGDLALSLRYAF